MRRIRNIFLTGIILSLPALVTLYILWIGFVGVDGLVGRVVQEVTGRAIPGLGVITFAGLIFLAGLFGTHFLGRRAVGWFDQLMVRIPIVRSIYGTVRQIVDSFVLGEAVFREVVFVEYPRLGVYTLGFVTGEGRPEEGMPELPRTTATRTWVRVFVPTTPNPTSGFLIVVPADEVIRTRFTIQQGMKMIVSGGVLWPAGPEGGEESPANGRANLNGWTAKGE